MVHSSPRGLAQAWRMPMSGLPSAWSQAFEGSSAITQVIERTMVPCVGIESMGLVDAHPPAAARQSKAANARFSMPDTVACGRYGSTRDQARRDGPEGLTLSDYAGLVLRAATQPAHLRHVAAEELPAEDLEEVVFRVARELLVVCDERVPQLHFLVEAERALLLVGLALDELRIEALERALERGAHARHERDLVHADVVARILHRLHRRQEGAGNPLARVEEIAHRLARIGHQLERVVVARGHHGAVLGAHLLLELAPCEEQADQPLDRGAYDRARVAQERLGIGVGNLEVREARALEKRRDCGTRSGRRRLDRLCRGRGSGLR